MYVKIYAKSGIKSYILYPQPHILCVCVAKPNKEKKEVASIYDTWHVRGVERSTEFPEGLLLALFSMILFLGGKTEVD